MFTSLFTRLGTWFLNTITNNLIQWLSVAIPKVILDWKDKVKKDAELKKAKESADKVLADPKSTTEQRAKAYEDALNTSSK
jgi:hypothetical protein